jgi:hypothetical protein
LYENDTDRECVGTPTVNVEPVAVPTPFVTERGPVVAPVGTVVVICVAEFTVKTAARPLNFTELTFRKFDPVITTVVAAGPIVGENEVITGGPTVKSAALVPVLIGVVTLTLPVVAPVGTVAVIWVEELTVFVVAAVALNNTTVAPQKLVPVITTDVTPAVPAVGLNDATVGAGAVETVKDTPPAVSPPDVVTMTLPVVAPHGTEVAICVASVIENVAAVPLNLTADALPPVVKSPPEAVIVTEVPGAPLVGLRAIVGIAAAAGSAVTSTATSPSAAASAVLRAVIFLRNLIEVLPSAVG